MGEGFQEGGAEGRHHAIHESFTSRSGVSEAISRSEVNVQSWVLLGPTSVHSTSYWLTDIHTNPNVSAPYTSP